MWGSGKSAVWKPIQSFYFRLIRTLETGCLSSLISGSGQPRMKRDCTDLNFFGGRENGMALWNWG
jgi:hypothetical protein